MRLSTFTVHAGGTPYTLTTTPALLSLGTTAPVLSIDEAGTYLIAARCELNYNNATFVANRTATIKLRRTNNTPADLTNGEVTSKTRIVTALTDV